MAKLRALVDPRVGSKVVETLKECLCDFRHL